MNMNDVDKSLFQRFDGLRIAWPSFRVAERPTPADGPRMRVTCLTRSEILDLFADEFVHHPAPLGHSTRRPSGA
jgi:hypothetical protein